MTAIVALVFFATAALADALTIAWHRAREARDVARCVALAAVIESINWLPIAVSIEGRLSPWIVAGVHVAGVVVGTACAMRRVRRQYAARVVR